MDKKPSPKYAALHGMPSGLARRIVTGKRETEQPPVKKPPAFQVEQTVDNDRKEIRIKVSTIRKRKAMKALAEAIAKPSSKRAQRWREKNPDLWLERQRLAAKKHRAKKKAERGK